MASTTMAIAMAPAGLASPLPLDLSSKSAFTTSRCASIPVSKQSKQCRNKIVCSADSDSKSGGAKFAAALAMAAIVGTASMAAAPAMADVAGLTPCKESKAFAKREKQSIKTLERSLKLYAPDSAPALALNAQIEKTKRRFDFYGKAGLLCGTDGLPHLIVDGDQKHLGEFVYPGIVFLYIAGWIGWVGRSYLIEVKSAQKPTEKEIIIDVPLALRLSWRGFIWPLAAISEFRNGKLIEDAANITVSPR